MIIQFLAIVGSIAVALFVVVGAFTIGDDDR